MPQEDFTLGEKRGEKKEEKKKGEKEEKNTLPHPPQRHFCCVLPSSSRPSHKGSADVLQAPGCSSVRCRAGCRNCSRCAQQVLKQRFSPPSRAQRSTKQGSCTSEQACRSQRGQSSSEQLASPLCPHKAVAPGTITGGSTAPMGHGAWFLQQRNPQ